MTELSPTDRLHYDAATGWLMLGDTASALEELKCLSPRSRTKPCVLELEWGIHADRQDWAAAMKVAEGLVESAPENTFGWIHRAYAARRLHTGGLSLAWNLLEPALDRFPEHPIIAYNLACYAAQLGRLDDAWLLFQRALASASKCADVIHMALADEDLKPLWPRIRAAHRP